MWPGGGVGPLLWLVFGGDCFGVVLWCGGFGGLFLGLVVCLLVVVVCLLGFAGLGFGC